MFRTIAFAEWAAALAADTNLLLQNLAGLPDTHVTVQGDNISVPSDTPNLMALYAQGGCSDAAAIMAQCRLQAPSLKPYLDVAAFTGFDTPIGDHLPISPTPINNYLGKGLNLVPGENLQVTTAEDVAGDDRAAIVALWLGDGNYDLGAMRNLPMETIRFVGQAAAVAAAWTPSAMVFDQALKAGMYAVVGMRFISTTPVIARLIFANQGARPGCIGYTTPVDGVAPVENPMFRNGNLGVWGTFSHTTPPQMELLCQVADAAAVQIGYLDVVKIG